jgi:periplasmic protein TonB
MASRPDGSFTALAALLSLALHGAVLAACLTAHTSGLPTPARVAVMLVSAVPGEAPVSAPETALAGTPAAAAVAVEAPTVAAAPTPAADHDVVLEPSRAAVPVPRPKPRTRIAAAHAAPALNVALAAPTPPVPAAAAEAARPPADAPLPPETSSGSSVAEKVEAAGAAAAPDAGATARDYLALISAALARHQRYPEDARRRQEQGTVLIAFALDRAGHVLSLDIRKGSGSAALDRAAEAMVRAADPLPPAPPSYPGARVEMVLPLTYDLTQ